MSLAELVDGSKAAIYRAHGLLQSGKYSDIVEMLEPVIGGLMAQRQKMPGILLVNFCLAQALNNCSAANYALGRLELAVDGWEQARDLYVLAATTPMQEVKKQSMEHGFSKYDAGEPEYFTLLRTEALAAIASSSLGLSQALQQLGRHEEAGKNWERAKAAYSILFDVSNETPIPAGALTKAAIAFANMCVKDGELEKARGLYFLAAAAQHELTYSDTLEIRRGLSTTARMMVMRN